MTPQKQKSIDVMSGYWGGNLPALARRSIYYEMSHSGNFEQLLQNGVGIHPVGSSLQSLKSGRCFDAATMTVFSLSW